MSTGIQPSLFFLNLPDVEKLVCVTLSLEERDEEPRSKQIKTCRELVLLYSDILASPVLGSFTGIIVVMASPFFHKGCLQAFAQRRHLQLSPPQRVFPGVLQCCMSYSLITRLSPKWNKAGQYLICGKDFLLEKGKLNAVGVELSSSEGQLCISVEVNSVRIPPPKLEDFDVPPVVLKRFYTDPESILDPSSTGGTLWCHVLPSMKKGQIITISRHLPKNGPFKSYMDLQNHWNQMYGYRLPELPEAEVVYCSVYFQLMGERLFTYPLSCIRLESLQRCPRVELQGTLDSFIFDFRERVKSLCGFPLHLSREPWLCSTSLNTATSVQFLKSQQINPTCTSATKPGLLLPHSSSSSTRASFLTQPVLPLTSSVSPLSSSPPCVISSTSSLPVFRPLSSTTFPCTSMHLPLPPFITSSKPVSISKTKQPSQHINISPLHDQKKNQQQQWKGEGRRERTRITFPTIGINTPAFRPSCTAGSSVLTHPPQPPPFIPQFTGCRKVSSSSKSSSVTTLPIQPAGFPPAPPVPKTKHTIHLNSTCMTNSNLVRQKMQVSCSITTVKKRRKAFSDSICKQAKTVTIQPLPEQRQLLHLTVKESDVSTKGKPTASSGVKNFRGKVRKVDVETMARSNQLSKVNSSTLLVWLKQHGVLVGTKHKKEELMLKVMACLNTHTQNTH